MADTGFDHEIIAQIAINGLGLGRRFHDYKGFTHSLLTRS